MPSANPASRRRSGGRAECRRSSAPPPPWRPQQGAKPGMPADLPNARTAGKENEVVVGPLQILEGILRLDFQAAAALDGRTVAKMGERHLDVGTAKQIDRDHGLRLPRSPDGGMARARAFIFPTWAGFERMAKQFPSTRTPPDRTSCCGRRLRPTVALSGRGPLPSSAGRGRRGPPGRRFRG